MIFVIEVRTAKGYAVTAYAIGDYAVVPGKSDCLFIKTGLFHKYIAELSLLCDYQDEQA